MASPIVRFTLICILLSAVLFFISAQVHDHYFKMEPTGFIYFLFGWFTGITILNYVLLVRAMERKPRSFINAYYITVMIRMLASTFILVAYIMMTDTPPLPAIVVFAALYFVYFILELVYLARLVKNKTPHQPV